MHTFRSVRSNFIYLPMIPELPLPPQANHPVCLLILTTQDPIIYLNVLQTCHKFAFLSLQRSSSTQIIISTLHTAFMDELRSYAMRLHTKEQAPREGQAAAPKEKQEWKPTTEGYLRFLIESQVVYNAFEGIMATVPECRSIT